MNKARLLAALYNASHPQGLGVLHADPNPMSEVEATKILERTQDFDYLKGRVMKVDLSGTELDPWGYDRDNGQGAVQRVIDGLNQGESK